MPIRKIITEFPRRYIESGEYMSAFSRISADLEMLLFDKLFFEKGIKAELMERWPLYTFIQWNLKMGLVDNKWEPLLTDFRKMRNKVIHGRVFLIKLLQNQTELNQAKKMLYSICEFIDKTEIVYNFNIDIEKEYGRLNRD